MSDDLLWVVSRAAGTGALLFSSLAVGLGLSMAMRLVKGRGVDLRVAHEALSLATLLALAVHVVALLGDSYFHPALTDVWLTAGIVAAAAMAALGLSFYVRDRIGRKRWRRLHRFTSVAWLLSIAHALGEGTDAGLTWFVVSLGVVGLPVALLLIARWLDTGSIPVARRT